MFHWDNHVSEGERGGGGVQSQSQPVFHRFNSICISLIVLVHRRSQNCTNNEHRFVHKASEGNTLTSRHTHSAAIYSITHPAESGTVRLHPRLMFDESRGVVCIFVPHTDQPFNKRSPTKIEIKHGIDIFTRLWAVKVSDVHPWGFKASTKCLFSMSIHKLLG